MASEIVVADFNLKIPDAVVSQKPVTIDDVEFIPDAYEEILKAEREGLITILRYDEMSERMKEWNRKTLLVEYEEAVDHPEYRHFLQGNFPELFHVEHS